jgi:hypothetical protein
MWLGFKIGAFNTVRLLKAATLSAFFVQIRHCFQQLQKIARHFSTRHIPVSFLAA